jgi:methionyl-tRNA formyltransferase
VGEVILKTIAVVSDKSWVWAVAEKFIKFHTDIEMRKIATPENLTAKSLSGCEFVFFPHWSFYIKEEIYANFNCIMFHPSDLPFGRGGTPIQNLIERGYKETVISAMNVFKEIDAGNVYLKRPLSLYGGGEEILLRMQKIIFEDMIPHILANDISPEPQSGEPTIFKRRTPLQSELRSDMSFTEIYDTIRMLDIDGYPNAYIKLGKYKIEFSRPSLKTGSILADVKITEEANNG